MQFDKWVATACLTLAVLAAPFAQFSDGAGFGAPAAFAKDKGGGSGGGNAGGKSGGNDGGKSSGKNSVNGRGSQTREARSQKGNFFTDAFATIASKKTTSGKRQLSEKRAKRPATKSFVNHPVDPVTTLASVPLEKPKTRPIEAKLAGLNSLNRNYRAYLNSSDPRMASIRDYAVAYATYELANGVNTLPPDSLLDDETLRTALEAAAKPGTVIDDEMLGWAKSTLGVGSAVGKIDEIREELAAAAPIEQVVDPVTGPVADLGDGVVTATYPGEATPEEVARPADSTETASVTP